jgi:hypothetical protein
MPPADFTETAFDTLHASLYKHVEGYEGNPVFDIAMGHIKNYDWASVDLNSAKLLAKNIGKGLMERGIAYSKDFAKDYVGKTVGTVIAGIGLTTGVTETALAVTALGVAVGGAIDWAVDYFTGPDFLEVGNEGYAPGDWVVIDVSIGASEQQTVQGRELRRRRRLVKAGVNVGVVAQRPEAGYVDVQNVQTGENRSYAINQLKKLPETLVSELEQNTDLKQIHDLFASKVRFPGEQMSAKTSTRNGDLVEYRGNTWRIERSTRESVLLESNGHRAQVQWDDVQLKDAWNNTTFQPAPDQEYAAFVTNGGFGKGDWVWFSDETMNGRRTLGVIFATKVEHVQLVSAFSGYKHTKETRDLEQAQGFLGRAWVAFRSEVVEGNLMKAESLAPGQQSSNNAQACLQSESHWQEGPKETWDRPSYGGETKPRESYDTPVDAWEDDTRVEYNDRYGRGWQEYAESAMSEEEYGGPVKQNNTAILMLAGAAIFAYALTR